jgi:hypothetical protein
LLGDEACWDERRDARAYAGEGPVITHPPCAAWCQLAGVREAKYGYPRGEDGGLFATALEQLFLVGGVLEHPAYSKAWPAHDLVKPYGTGWCYAPDARAIAGRGGYHICQVSQCAYGHRARKRTWLLYVGQRGPFDLDWSEPYVPGTIVISGAKNHVKNPTERMWTREAKATPEKFARELIRLAEWSRGDPCQLGTCEHACGCGSST